MDVQQASGRAMVAIVDDDEGTRHSLEWLIRSSGHRAVSFGSARRYLEVFGEESCPDCIIIDIAMPEMGGMQLRRILNDRNPNLPVIFITGAHDSQLEERARRLGCEGFFTKPLDTDALIAAIDRAVVPYKRG